MVGLLPLQYPLHPRTKKGNGIPVNLRLLKRAGVEPEKKRKALEFVPPSPPPPHPSL